MPFLTFRFARMVSGVAKLMVAKRGGAVPLIQKLCFDTTQASNRYFLPFLIKLMPVDRVLFGSDFLAASPLETVDGLRAFSLTRSPERASSG